MMIVQKQAKQIVAQHKTQPPHQNRLGLSVGAAGRAPEDDTQVTTNHLSCASSLPLRVQSSFCVTDGLCMLTAGKAQSYTATMAINNGKQAFDTVAIGVSAGRVILGSSHRNLPCSAYRRVLRLAWRHSIANELHLARSPIPASMLSRYSMTHLLQEMGFDSIPFEEPDLFTARSGLQAKDRLADRQDSTLHLRLDSQDDLDTGFAEVGTEL